MSNSLDEYIENFSKIQAQIINGTNALDDFSFTRTQDNKCILLHKCLSELYQIVLAQHKQMIEMNNIFGKED